MPFLLVLLRLNHDTENQKIIASIVMRKKKVYMINGTFNVFLKKFLEEHFFKHIRILLWKNFLKILW